MTKENKTNCKTCDNCQYEGGGDWVCEVTGKLVMTGYVPSKDYMACAGDDYYPVEE